MSNVIEEKTKISALAVMAGRFNVEPSKLLATLKETVFKGATDSELMALVIVANLYELNPFLKEIYAFPAKGGGIVPVVSIDGWLKIINNHPQMDGIEYEYGEDKDGKLISCTCTIYRKDRNRPIRVTEFLSECERNTEPWKMKRRMMRHKTTIQCGRVAFGFSGIMEQDEAERITVTQSFAMPTVANESRSIGYTIADPTPMKQARRAIVKNDPPTTIDEERAEGNLPLEKKTESSIPLKEMMMEEIPMTFEPNTPQRELALKLSEMGVIEAEFVDFVGKKFNVKSALLSEFSDSAAQDALKNLDTIIAMMGGAK